MYRFKLALGPSRDQSGELILAEVPGWIGNKAPPLESGVKIDELTKAMLKAPSGRAAKKFDSGPSGMKQQSLAAAGISRQDASEYERLAEVM